MSKHALVTAMQPYEQELIAIRQDIHRNPEVGFEEIRGRQRVHSYTTPAGTDPGPPFLKHFGPGHGPQFQRDGGSACARSADHKHLCNNDAYPGHA